MGRIKNTAEKADISQCRKCLYKIRETTDNIIFCGYLYYTGKRRPCEPSPHCTAFVKYTKNEKDLLAMDLIRLGGWLSGRE